MINGAGEASVVTSTLPDNDFANLPGGYTVTLFAVINDRRLGGDCGRSVLIVRGLRRSDW